MESRPLSLRFATQFALRSNPALGFEFLCIRAPNLFAATLRIWRPEDVVALADTGTVRPDIVIQSILLVEWYRGVEAQDFIESVEIGLRNSWLIEMAFSFELTLHEHISCP